MMKFNFDYLQRRKENLIENIIIREKTFSVAMEEMQSLIILPASDILECTRSLLLRSSSETKQKLTCYAMWLPLPTKSL